MHQKGCRIVANFHSDDFRQTRNVVIQPDPPKNRKAVVAFFISLLFFIPLAPLVAVVLAIAAMKKTEDGTRRGGMKLAGCAIHLGLLLTIGQFFFGYRGYEYVQQVTAGPGDALSAGFAGNTAQFRAAFMTTLPTSDAEAKRFIEELQSRYGNFRIDVPGDAVNSSLTAPREYELTFDKATVTANAAVAFDSELSARWLTSRLQYIKIHDPEHGDLTFPAPKPRHVAAQPVSD
jgi:hypothetical protein